ncbi:Pentatricopeptide repeat [Dillenia turbinata]|uniref:Pentatricopeptide repeat n=1 Tax=Dillenia turbinata TaxID=194707 RepID=A0AAN8VXP7_9MAGN
MVTEDIIAWTSMVDGLGRHGLRFEALKLFSKMVDEGLQLNSVAFLSLLSACSHCGLVTEGWEVFCSMKWKFASRVYGNRKIGKYAAQKLLDIEPDNVGYYTIWSSIEAIVLESGFKLKK